MYWQVFLQFSLCNMWYCPWDLYQIKKWVILHSDLW